MRCQNLYKLTKSTSEFCSKKITNSGNYFHSIKRSKLCFFNKDWKISYSKTERERQHKAYEREKKEPNERTPVYKEKKRGDVAPGFVLGTPF